MAPPTVLQNRTSDMTNTDIDREMPDHFHDHVTSDRTCMQDRNLMQAFVQASGRSAAFVSPPDHLIELINSGFMNTVTTSHFMGLLPRYSHAPHQICPLKLRGGGRDDDTRDPKVPQWDGTPGAPFERAKREIRVHMTGYFVSPTDDYNIWDHFTGVDQGGDDPQAAGIAAGAGRQTQMRIYNKRSTKAWSFACEILPDDSNIRRLLLQLDEKQEIQGRPNNFVGLGRQAWKIICQHGEREFDDEYILEARHTFDTITILAAVGYGEDTVGKFARHLTKIVFLVPAAQQPSEEEKAKRVLSQLSKEAPDALAYEATKELKAAAADRLYMHAAPVGGVATRDLARIVTYFGKQWDSLVKNGKISIKAPTGKIPDASALAAQGQVARELAQQHVGETHTDDMVARAVRTLNSHAPGSDEFVLAAQILVSGNPNEPDRALDSEGARTTELCEEIEDFDNDHAFTVEEWNTYAADADSDCEICVKIRRATGPICDGAIIDRAA